MGGMGGLGVGGMGEEGGGGTGGVRGGGVWTLNLSLWAWGRGWGDPEPSAFTCF